MISGDYCMQKCVFISVVKRSKKKVVEHGGGGVHVPTNAVLCNCAHTLIIYRILSIIFMTWENIARITFIPITTSDSFKS